MKSIKKRLIEKGTFMRARIGIYDCLESALGIVEETLEQEGVVRRLYLESRCYINLRNSAVCILEEHELKEFDKRYETLRRKCLDRGYKSTNGVKNETTNT